LYYEGDFYVATENTSGLLSNGSLERPYTLIQEALDNASEGQVILVAAGTYEENIMWPGTSGVKLYGENKDTTIIDGMGEGTVIEFISAAVVDTEIKAVTIQNGYSENYTSGLYILAEQVTVEDVRFTGNIGGRTIEASMGNFWNEDGLDQKHIFNDIEIIENRGSGIFLNEGDYEINRSLISIDEFQEHIITGYPIEFAWQGSNVQIQIDHSTILVEGYHENQNINDGSDTEPYNYFFGHTAGMIFNISVTNSILWGVEETLISHFYNINDNQIFDFRYNNINNGCDNNFYVEYYYNGSEYDNFTCIGNIDEGPLLNEDFTLGYASPCINAGDPNSEPDSDGTTTDMGVYPFDFTPYHDGEVIISEAMVNPNSFSPDKEYVELYNPTDSVIWLYNWDIGGYSFSGDYFHNISDPDMYILPGDYFVFEASNLHCSQDYRFAQSQNNLRVIYTYPDR
jgi:hypothetical protein